MAFVVLPFLSCLLLFSSTVAENMVFKEVSLSSLLPTDKCSLSTGERRGIDIVHRNGPCFSKTTLTGEGHQVALTKDSLRAASIQKRVVGSRSAANSSIILESQISVPAKSGLNIGAGDYIITVAFGTPAKTQTVIFDTGSDVSWIQCQPCVSTCYSQKEPLFDPAQSSTYHNFTCNSSTCQGLLYNGCYNSNTCLYGVAYGDGSSTVGFLASDTLRLGSTNEYKNFIFGCGEKNIGLFNGFAGLIGLGRSPYSLNLQLAPKLGNVFSYCLPSTSNGTGYLNLGKPVKTPSGYIPIITDSRAPSLYFVNLTGITVGEKKLEISPAVFTSSGTVIDSGTVITRLPPAAYSRLKMAFRADMRNYPLAPAFSILDTCYDLSRSKTVTFPVIKLQYGELDITVPTSGVFYTVNSSRVCLAFAGNSNAGQITIIGNVQQRTMEVTYDNVLKRIGFSSGACN